MKVKREQLPMDAASVVPPSVEFSVQLQFHEALKFFLRPITNGPLIKILREKTSVKDVIESCGVPHPEVDVILVNGSPVDFAFSLRGPSEVEIFGGRESPSAFAEFRLQSCQATRFVADGHLGKLVRILRLLGVDVAYNRSADDRGLLEVMLKEDRALLTRDRRLLMHAVVRHGYYPRSQIPEEQTLEVVRRFNLADALAPYTRCLRCNAALALVEKRDVFSQLKPLTQIYYQDFRQCVGCRKIYWPGSHFPKLQARIAQLKSEF
jgi:uncharacterized protein with PIN domain/sulfur carrier protein ThiS